MSPDVERLRKALTDVAEYDATEDGDTPLDEWAQAAAFDEVQRIARAALDE